MYVYICTYRLVRTVYLMAIKANYNLYVCRTWVCYKFSDASYVSQVHPSVSCRRPLAVCTSLVMEEYFVM